MINRRVLKIVVQGGETFFYFIFFLNLAQTVSTYNWKASSGLHSVDSMYCEFQVKWSHAAMSTVLNDMQFWNKIKSFTTASSSQ